MWLAILSDQLPVVALVGHYPANKLIGRDPLPVRRSFRPPGTPPKDRMRYYPGVSPAIPHTRAG